MANESPQARTFDLKNPDQVVRQRSSDYRSYYTNHIEINIGQNEASMVIVQSGTAIRDEKSGDYKALLEEQSRIFLTHSQLLGLRNLLNRLVKDDNPKFRDLLSKAKEPDSEA